MIPPYKELDKYYDWESFGIYDPNPKFAKEEQQGQMGYNGRNLPFIMSKSQIPMPPLEPSLEDMLKHLWKAAWPSDDAWSKGQQKFLGQHRAGASPLFGPQVPGNVGGSRPPLVNPSINPLIVKGLPPVPKGLHLQGVARDWLKMLEIKRVAAYCFRGDKRDPSAIRSARGFCPPSTRTDEKYLLGDVFRQFQDYLQRRFNWTITLDDYKNALAKSMQKNKEVTQLFVEYSIWRAILHTEENHLERMLANEALKGYISTTKAVTVAKGFGKNGWAYCLRVNGGFLVPLKNGVPGDWGNAFGEQEIAFPGPISWDDVVGFRKVNGSGKFEGPIYLRIHFIVNQDAKAADQVYDLLSGKKQG